MKTSLRFEAPNDLSVGTIQIIGPGHTLADWVATPANRVFQQDDVEPGVYTSIVSPTGLSSRSVVFEVHEGQANTIVLPSFSALSSSGNTTSFFDVQSQLAVAEIPSSVVFSSFEQSNQVSPLDGATAAQGTISDARNLLPLEISKNKKRISIGLSQERQGRDTFDVFRGKSTLELFSGRLEIEVATDALPNHLLGQRVRLSAAIEQLRVERCLLPCYRGGTRITVTAPDFSAADLELIIVPVDPRLRALLRVLDAGTSAEVIAVRDDVLGHRDAEPDIDQIDPWAAILVGLLAIRFAQVFPQIDRAWANNLVKRANWAYDAHVIQASQLLSAAQLASSRIQEKAVTQAVRSLAMAQVNGSPYYRYTNQLFGEMAVGIADFLKTERQHISASTRNKFNRLYTRWNRELALQRGAGATFTWLARDQHALKQHKLLVPYRGSSGYLRRDSASILFEGRVSAGQIEVIRGGASAGTHFPGLTSVFSSNASVPSDAFWMPALGRPAGPADDPNKGRFGGLADREGFQLTSAFEPTESSEWFTVVLTLEAKRTVKVGLGDFAWFVLHPTFLPSLLKVVFRGRRAQLRLKVWGGFTVGVWLPKFGLELECDLALLEGAPHNIRVL